MEKNPVLARLLKCSIILMPVVKPEAVTTGANNHKIPSTIWLPDLDTNKKAAIHKKYVMPPQIKEMITLTMMYLMDPRTGKRILLIANLKF